MMNLKKKIEDLEKALEEKSKENDELREQLKNDKVDNAISVGELSPNKKDFAVSLNDKALDEFLEMNKKDLEHLKNGTNQTQKNEKELSDEQKQVNESLGLNEEAE